MNRNKTIGAVLAASILLSNMPVSFADSAKVVTMAADLNPKQQEAILKYFGVTKDSVDVVNVNNQDERHYLEGVASDSQIGTKTYSCCYIEPTKTGSGINVRTANLTYVTASMISSTLITAGVKDANVLAAAPFKVSGTGALTGCFKAFETATGEKLEEKKKELATEEIVTTGKLGDQYSPEVATGMVNDMKAEVIKNGTSDKTQIAETINNISNNYNINLTQDNKDDLEKLLTKISEEKYNYKDVKDSLNQVADGVSDQLSDLGIKTKTGNNGVIYNIKNFFVNMFDNKDLGILEKTNDAALGASAVIDSTEESLKPVVDEIKDSNIFEKIANWFKSLFKHEEKKTIDDLDDSGDVKNETNIESKDEFTNQDNGFEGEDPYQAEGDFGNYPEKPDQTLVDNLDGEI